MNKTFLGKPNEHIINYCIAKHTDFLNFVTTHDAKLRLTFRSANYGLDLYEYSTDKINWKYPSYIHSPYGDHDYYIPVKANEKVYLKGSNDCISSKDVSMSFKLNAEDETQQDNIRISFSGSIMSILDPTCKRKDVPDYCFSSLFDFIGNRLLTAPSLPATQLTQYSYATSVDSIPTGSMFNNCTLLTVAPDLPAEILDIDDIEKYKIIYDKLFSFSKQITSASFSTSYTDTIYQLLVESGCNMFAAIDRQDITISCANGQFIYHANW